MVRSLELIDTIPLVVRSLELIDTIPLVPEMKIK